MSSKKGTNQKSGDNIKRKGDPNSTTRRGMIIGGTAALAGVAAVGIARPDQASAQQPQEKDPNERTTMGRLKGQVALVTGAARGIGRACAVALAKQGANVALVDIAENIPSVEYPLATAAELEEAKRLVEAEGRKAIAIKADVRKGDQMRSAAKRTIKEFGKVDILVANAGILTYGFLEDMSDAAWDDVIDVNLSGVARSMRAVIPHMKGRKQGRIIVVNSCNSRFGSPGSPSYNASKWGVVGLTKCAAIELAKDGITVNGVNPTGVRTPMTQNDVSRHWANPDNPTQENLEKALYSLNAQPRSFLDPEEVANALVFFAMPEAACITGEFMDVAAGANARWNS